MACMAHIDAASLHLSEDPLKMIPQVSQAASLKSLALPPQAAFLASLTRTPEGLQVPWNVFSPMDGPGPFNDI